MKRDDLPDGRLGELLSAAAAPGRRHELRGEEDAVAGFRQEYQPRNAPAHRPRRKRRLLAVFATAFVAIGVGGTAFAASTGNLPAPVQVWFDNHTGPDPDKSPKSAASASQSAHPSASPRPSSLPVEFCKAWQERDAKPITAELRQELSRLAGGEATIDTYCHRVLGNPASPSPSRSSARPSPSRTERAAPTATDDQGENDNSQGDEDGG
ncbi:hypothetical protein ACQP00_01510 [Dactylosporangium sp. CS-047395]|uniref:hypothetical protein n=1 Tax=Dactylosporangium sp. CS-047395 TaxID=3239936 RepID=UPI003D8D6B6D